MANKVRFGLKNVYVASVTQADGGAVTFGTPEALPGAVKMSLEAAGDTTDFYADDQKYFTDTANNGYTGELEIAELPQSFVVNYLGATVDSNGNVIEQTTDKAKNFALLFEFNGDEKAVRHILYYCKASRPKLESETTSESKEPKTTTLEFSAIAIPGTDIVKGYSGSESSNYDSWFNKAPVTPVFA